MNAAVTADPVPIGTSETYDVAPVSTAIYPVTDASVRYFPKADVHSFADPYEPKIGSVDASGNVHFIVPVNVPPYFSSSVTTTTSGGTVNGPASIVSNSDGNSNQYSNGDVSGLSYAPTTNGSFQLSVKYTSNENTAIETIGVVSQAVKMQGLPSSSFTVPASSWDRANQQIDYTLSITATENTSHRMDGWNVYTKLSTADSNSWISHGSLLRTTDELTNYVDLSNSNYAAYATIDVKFVATRSIYLFSSNTSDQRETVQPNNTKYEQIVHIITLPETLPAPTADDITLENIVYNTLIPTTTAQNGALTVSKITSSNSANIARITITGPNDSTVTVHTFNSTLPLSIALTSTSTELTYSVTYDYNQYVDNVLAPSESSSGTVVTFTTSTSTRNAPVIDSKSYSESNEEFTLRYTSVNNGTLSDSAEITSIAYVKPYDAVNNNAAVELSDANGNDADGEGNVDASGNAGMRLVLYVVDSFVTSYSVSNSSTSHDTDAQIIQSPNSDSFLLAANPKIDEDSIVVNSYNNKVKFSVFNNGSYPLHMAVLTMGQDSSNHENDLGFYLMCIFTPENGFTRDNLNVAVPDELGLDGSSHTLKATSIDNTGMAMVTKFEFTSSVPFSTTPANVLVYVKSNTEGADSASFGNVQLTDGRLQIVNGTVKYTGDSIPAPLPITFNGTNYLVVTNNYNGAILYANASTGQVTYAGITYPFNHLVTTLITYMDGLFFGSAFNQSISSWDTSNVTDMSNMFNGSQFNQPIGNWNTSNVTKMSQMFQETAFNQPINTNGNSWNTSNVIDMHDMFSDSQFNQPIGNWNTANVTAMNSMFFQSYEFNQPIGTWNTANVTVMSSMFINCVKFNQDISSWNTSKVTSMNSMFQGTVLFNQPINTNGNSWNTSKVANMTTMFYCSAFNQPIGNWNTSNVTNMATMFFQNYHFNQPIGNWNTAKVTDMSNMFAYSPFNQPINTIGNSWNTSNVTNMNYMFLNTTAFNQYIGGWNVTNVTPKPPSGFNDGNSTLTSENSPVWT